MPELLARLRDLLAALRGRAPRDGDVPCHHCGRAIRAGEGRSWLAGAAIFQAHDRCARRIAVTSPDRLPAFATLAEAQRAWFEDAIPGYRG